MLGYPTGGETISVTKGVVSRVEVVTYIHAASQLLGIQIDAAINAGNSGGPALLGKYDAITSDASDNENGNGNGMSNKKVIGIAFQNMPDADNVGYIIPTPIIEHFLGDIDRFGEYKGFCSLGINYQTLPDTRAIHKFFGANDENITGILVTGVVDHSPASKIIKKYDIIMAIDGHKVMNDGTAMVDFNKFSQKSEISGNFDKNDQNNNTSHNNNNSNRHESIAMEYLISRKYHNDEISIDVWRQDPETKKGSVIKLKTTCKVTPYMVPIHQFDTPSSYYIFGGCVFIKLTQPFLHTWGEDWYHYAPRDLLTEAMKGAFPAPNIDTNIDTNINVNGNGNGIETDDLKQEFEGENESKYESEKNNADDKDSKEKAHNKKEMVLMCNVLPTTVNMGANRHCNVILDKIGDKSVRSLSDLKSIIENKVLNNEKLIDFHFRESRLMVLDIEASILKEKDLLQRYRIPHRQSMDLDCFDNKEFELRIEQLYKTEGGDSDNNINQGPMETMMGMEMGDMGFDTDITDAEQDYMVNVAPAAEDVAGIVDEVDDDASGGGGSDGSKNIAHSNEPEGVVPVENNKNFKQMEMEMAMPSRLDHSDLLKDCWKEQTNAQIVANKSSANNPTKADHCE